MKSRLKLSEERNKVCSNTASQRRAFIKENKLIIFTKEQQQEDIFGFQSFQTQRNILRIASNLFCTQRKVLMKGHPLRQKKKKYV